METQYLVWRMDNGRSDKEIKTCCCITSLNLEWLPSRSRQRQFAKQATLTKESARVMPGVYYRDFDAKTAGIGVMLPSYPASRDLCTLGGMVSNNSGGEKSLQYGKTDKYVTELSVVLADGNEDGGSWQDATRHGALDDREPTLRL